MKTMTKPTTSKSDTSISNEMEYKNIEHKQVHFEIKKIEEESSDFFTFEGFASTFGNIDRGDDAIQPGAFKQSLTNLIPKLLWQHKMSEPLGVFTEIKETEKGLFVKGRMPKSDDFVRGRVIPQMKVGSIDSMSIGFSIVEEDFKTIKGKTVRLINKVDLFEISLVTIPMNPKAVVMDMKAAVPFQELPLPITSEAELKEINFDLSWSSSDAVSRVREHTSSHESPSETYKTAFLWHDKENPKNFESYKLPIADVVSGELKAVPRAIFSATAALRGARSKVAIPEAELVGVIDNINKYYEKMKRESPFIKGFSPLFMSFKSITDISTILKAYGFSNNETNSLIGAVKKITDSQKVKENESDAIRSFTNSLKDLSNIIKK